MAPPQRAAQALARYPHAPFGAPVIAPQQPGVPVYHNRAIWPFVTAYALKAAKKDVDIKIYDAEGHGWSKLENRYDFARRVETFLAKQLK